MLNFYVKLMEHVALKGKRQIIMWILPRVTGPVTSEWLGFCTWIQDFFNRVGEN